MALVLLRAFNETGEPQVANDFAHRVAGPVTAAGCSVSKTKVKAYWKIPEYMEVSIEFHVADDQFGIDGAMKALGTGWFRQRHTEAIWNPSEDATFVDDSVRWAHLEVVA